MCDYATLIWNCGVHYIEYKPIYTNLVYRLSEELVHILTDSQRDTFFPHFLFNFEWSVESILS